MAEGEGEMGEGQRVRVRVEHEGSALGRRSAPLGAT